MTTRSLPRQLVIRTGSSSLTSALFGWWAEQLHAFCSFCSPASFICRAATCSPPAIAHHSLFSRPFAHPASLRLRTTYQQDALLHPRLTRRMDGAQDGQEEEEGKRWCVLAAPRFLSPLSLGQDAESAGEGTTGAALFGSMTDLAENPKLALPPWKATKWSAETTPRMIAEGPSQTS